VRGERTLFSGLAFRVEPGTLLRVAGPNGTGKTSLLKLVCGLLQPAAGEIRWRGENIRRLHEEYRRHLLYLGHLPAVKDDLTVLENLRVACAVAGRPVAEAAARGALAELGLEGYEDTHARFLSQGQRRRIALARLFVSRGARLWVLDEPFTALDVHGVARLTALVGEHVGAGNMVALTTHQEAAIDAPRTQVVELGARRAPAC
jgi:heme exporter protein A